MYFFVSEIYINLYVYIYVYIYRKVLILYKFEMLIVINSEME